VRLVKIVFKLACYTLSPHLVRVNISCTFGLGNAITFGPFPNRVNPQFRQVDSFITGRDPQLSSDKWQVIFL
jgi:hypothetical protein